MFYVGRNNKWPKYVIFFFSLNSLTVDEIQAKVAFIHDEERVISEDEAAVSLLFPQIC